MRFSRRPGFSLMELLLAAVLVPVIGFVIFAAFGSGVRLWKASQQSLASEDVQIFFQKATADVEQAFLFQSVGFGGNSAEFYFAGLSSGVPGRLRYAFDADHHRVVREASSVAQLFEEEAGALSTVLQHVRSMEISYFTYDKTGKVFGWSSELDPKAKELPVAVRFRVVVDDEGRAAAFTRTIAVPAGNV